MLIIKNKAQNIRNSWANTKISHKLTKNKLYKSKLINDKRWK